MSVVESKKEGTIRCFYDGETGKILEAETRKPFYFAQDKAKETFTVNEAVTFTYVTIPNGKVIVKNVVRK